jgi:hypothetical protein
MKLVSTTGAMDSVLKKGNTTLHDKIQLPDCTFFPVALFTGLPGFDDSGLRPVRIMHRNYVQCKPLFADGHNMDYIQCPQW